MNDLVREALQVAQGELGVREVGSSNSGQRVDQYLASTGLDGGAPWCAAFVVWCIQRAAASLKLPSAFPRTAYCPTIAGWAKGLGCLHTTPADGDVFLKYGTVNGVYRASHTGFVLAANGTKFATIEGNSNTTGSREGTSVVRLNRIASERFRFVRYGEVMGNAKPAAAASPAAPSARDLLAAVYEASAGDHDALSALNRFREHPQIVKVLGSVG